MGCAASRVCGVEPSQVPQSQGSTFNTSQIYTQQPVATQPMELPTIKVEAATITSNSNPTISSASTPFATSTGSTIKVPTTPDNDTPRRDDLESTFDHVLAKADNEALLTVDLGKQVKLRTSLGDVVDDFLAREGDIDSLLMSEEFFVTRYDEKIDRAILMHRIDRFCHLDIGTSAFKGTRKRHIEPHLAFNEAVIFKVIPRLLEFTPSELTELPGDIGYQTLATRDGDMLDPPGILDATVPIPLWKNKEDAKARLAAYEANREASQEELSWQSEEVKRNTRHNEAFSEAGAAIKEQWAKEQLSEAPKISLEKLDTDAASEWSWDPELDPVQEECESLDTIKDAPQGVEDSSASEYSDAEEGSDVYETPDELDDNNNNCQPSVGIESIEVGHPSLDEVQDREEVTLDRTTSTTDDSRVVGEVILDDVAHTIYDEEKTQGIEDGISEQTDTCHIHDSIRFSESFSYDFATCGDAFAAADIGETFLPYDSNNNVEVDSMEATTFSDDLNQTPKRDYDMVIDLSLSESPSSILTVKQLVLNAGRQNESAAHMNKENVDSTRKRKLATSADLEKYSHFEFRRSPKRVLSRQKPVPRRSPVRGNKNIANASPCDGTPSPKYQRNRSSRVPNSPVTPLGMSTRINSWTQSDASYQSPTWSVVATPTKLRL